jgi:hypothetical protein
MQNRRDAPHCTRVFQRDHHPHAHGIYEIQMLRHGLQTDLTERAKTLYFTRVRRRFHMRLPMRSQTLGITHTTEEQEVLQVSFFVFSKIRYVVS